MPSSPGMKYGEMTTMPDFAVSKSAWVRSARVCGELKRPVIELPVPSSSAFSGLSAAAAALARMRSRRPWEKAVPMGESPNMSASGTDGGCGADAGEVNASKRVRSSSFDAFGATMRVSE